MQLIFIATFLAVALAAPMQQSLSVKDDGSYQFYYETGKDAGSQTRSETRHPDGVVIGRFSYEDANGDIREVSYRADDSGYVANGDVSVEGAPKGQFPAPSEEIEEESRPKPAPVKEDHQPSDAPVQEKPHQDAPSDVDHEAMEDIKGLILEESAVNEPPEGFPQGYFLQNFHGLRRLPEPTKEEDPTPKHTTPEAKNQDKSKSSTTEEKNEAKTKPSAAENDKKASTKPSDTKEEVREAAAAEEYEAPQPEEVSVPEDPSTRLSNEMLMHLRPFQNFGAPQMDSGMFHEPVYIFSYHNPDSYGYHYYF